MYAANRRYNYIPGVRWEPPPESFKNASSGVYIYVNDPIYEASLRQYLKEAKLQIVKELNVASSDAKTTCNAVIAQWDLAISYLTKEIDQLKDDAYEAWTNLEAAVTERDSLLEIRDDLKKADKKISKLEAELRDRDDLAAIDAERSMQFRKQISTLEKD